jgi:hypothetical protein
MGSVAERTGVVVIEGGRSLPEHGINWGFVLVIASCVVFWCTVIVGAASLAA